MKNQFFILPSLIIVMACGNEEKIINHFAECARQQEICEDGCELTQEQEAALEACYNMCIFNWEQNGFSSQYACIVFCQQGPNGPEAVAKCKKECKEDFYECGFGPDWRDLNIRRPQ